MGLWLKSPPTNTWVFGTILILVFTCVLVLNAGNENTQIHPKPARTDWSTPVGYTRNTTAVRAKPVAVVHVAIVVCGDRLEEALVLVKSGIIFSRTKLVFHIFTEDNKRKLIQANIEKWPDLVRSRVKVKMYKTEFNLSSSCPECKPEEWKNLFRPCATQRLFIPDILTDVDSVIYMDTDTLFLSPLEDVWSNFDKFTQNQMFGIVSELNAYYPTTAIPYCTDTGANSGVMLMNLTRIRQVKWMTKMVEYFKQYRKHITLGDQDLINIYCHFYPGQFYIMECVWNYRGIFCPVNNTCPQGETEGAYILHGNSMMFHINKMPAIRAVYESIKEQNLTSQNLQDLLSRMDTKLKKFHSTPCGKIPKTLTRHLQKYVTRHAKMTLQEVRETDVATRFLLKRDGNFGMDNFN